MVAQAWRELSGGL